MAKTGELFGLCCAASWKDSNKTYGSAQNFLFALQPAMRIMRAHPGSKETDFQWLNERGYQMPHGFGCGSPERGFRLFLNEGLDACVAKSSDLNFEAGAMLGPTGTQGRFELAELQVYACGGDAVVERGLQGRKLARQVAGEKLQKARQVDRAAFAENAFDREMLLGNTFAHQAHVKDRPSECK
jgi:hypothetical protein